MIGVKPYAWNSATKLFLSILTVLRSYMIDEYSQENGTNKKTTCSFKVHFLKGMR
jgi:hypothetical protein